MVVITKNIAWELASYLSSHKHDKIFVLTDTHTHDKCLPLLNEALLSVNPGFITIEAGDTHKDLEQVAVIWDVLSKSGASRNSLLVNIGGGMVTDLGGFAGATFKRGLHNLNIPTTLMASVDAAVGGKTGINFNGLKNEIGCFYQPDGVMIDCSFLKTLDRDNLLSGYAEMIKHGLISNKKLLDETLLFDIEQKEPDIERLNDLVGASVAIKKRIVEEDPKETGIRKALNFGHTIGHALESLSFSKNSPILHGHAVAAGIISELYLSYKICGMPVETVRRVTNFIKEHYPPFFFTCDDYDTIYELMTHDKKNEGGQIFFTLLGNIGDIRIHRKISREAILDALDFYRENIY
ncbi:MAG: 3-dehydroquinate synthase [Tannerella sp.]|jgi:3-dehydroquinate synthase|nr:3-dehydroquinate synthase [Tannerella sp.]